MENEIIKNDSEGGRGVDRQRDGVNQKIILFVIGVLVGAVISTGAFLAYAKIAGVGGSSGSSMQAGPGGTPPEMPSGSNGSNGQGGTPPEKPENSNNNSTNNGNSQEEVK